MLDKHLNKTAFEICFYRELDTYLSPKVMPCLTSSLEVRDCSVQSSRGSKSQDVTATLKIKTLKNFSISLLSVN